MALAAGATACPSFVALDDTYAASVVECADLMGSEDNIRRWGGARASPRSATGERSHPRSHPCECSIGKESMALLHRATHEATRVLDVLGVAPKLTDWESTGGAYFVRDPADGAGSFLAVIKPEDEEPYALNNPKRSGQEMDEADDGAPVLKALRPPTRAVVVAAAPAPSPPLPPAGGGGKPRRGKRWPPTPPLPPVAPPPPPPRPSPAPVVDYIRKGILPGEGAAREAAAFLLDHNHSAGVPVRVRVLAASAPLPHASLPPHL